MNIYRLNKHIVIEKRTTSMDAIGNEISTWSTYYKCHATFSNNSGAERRQDGQLLPQANYNIIVRDCAKTKCLNSSDYRIVFNSDIFNIKFVDTSNFERGYIKVEVEVADNGKQD